MFPIKDILPPQTTPRAAIGIVVLSAAAVALTSWLHVAGWPDVVLTTVNLILLWVFADNVEDRLGHGRFVLLYGLCGAAGVVAGGRLSPAAPVLAALTSGAVSGVLGAYFALFPRSRVLMFVPFVFELYEMPALFLLSLSFTLHVAGGLDSVGAFGSGFVAGAGLCLLLRRPDRGRIEWWGQITKREQGAGSGDRRDQGDQSDPV